MKSSHRTPSIKHPKKHQAKVLVLNIYGYGEKGNRSQKGKTIFRAPVQDRMKDSHKSRRIKYKKKDTLPLSFVLMIYNSGMCAVLEGFGGMFNLMLVSRDGVSQFFLVGIVVDD